MSKVGKNTPQNTQNEKTDKERFHNATIHFKLILGNGLRMYGKVKTRNMYTATEINGTAGVPQFIMWL